MSRTMTALSSTIGFALTIRLSAADQTLTERIRQAKDTPEKKVVVGNLGEPVSLSVDELVKRVDLIVEASLTRINSHRDATDHTVVTDYSIHPLRVFAGTVPGLPTTPGATSPFILTTNGGEIVVDGITVRANDYNLRTLTDGGHYLLFLKRWKEPGVFTVFNVAAFELTGNQMKPMTYDGSDLYKGLSRRPYADAVLWIQKAVLAR
jgi:hypothetical protein